MFSKPVMQEINKGLSMGRHVFEIDGQHIFIDKTEGKMFQRLGKSGPAAGRMIPGERMIA